MKTNIQQNFSFGYVMGVLKGDGSLNRSIDYHYFDHKGRQVVKAKSVRRVPRYRYSFVLGVMDEDFRNAFAEHLEKVTGKKVCRWTTKNGVHKAILVSKEWYEKILPLRQDIAWVKTTDQEFKRGFLRAMYDSEGSVTIPKKRPNQRIIELTKARETVETCQCLLADFGINATLHPIRKTDKAMVLRFTRKEYVDIFRKEINFEIKRKRDRLEFSA